MSRLLRWSLMMMLAIAGVVGGANAAVAAPGSQADAGMAPQQVTTGASVSLFACEGVDGPTWGGEPDVSCDGIAGTFSFYLVGDGSGEPEGQLVVDESGQGEIELVAGSYEVYHEETQAMFEVAVLDGAVTPITLLIPRAVDPGPDMGVIEISSYLCDGLEAPEWNTNPDVDCTPGGAGTFSFYLYGDDSGEPVAQLDVDESGVGSIELVVGSYAVVDEVTGAEVDIDVIAEGPSLLTLLRPSGETPAPEAGTVNASVFYCSNIEQVIFSSDSFATTYADLPTFDPACEPGAATLTFYLVGDGTDDFWQLDVDGTGSIEVAAGNYEVVEEGTQASTAITVVAGDFITLDVQIPTGEFEPGASVNLVKFYCENVTEVEFLSYDMAEYSDRDDLANAPDCVSGSATFTFYLVGDETADYAQIDVNGSGSIGLFPGTYEVIEEGTQASFTLDVLEGENTLLVVNNPLPDDGDVPGPPDNGDGNGTTPPDDGDNGDDDAIGLPSTGHGAGGSESAMAMTFAAVASLFASAGAFVLRREQI